MGITDDKLFSAIAITLAVLFTLFSAIFIGVSRTFRLQFLGDIQHWMLQQIKITKLHFVYIAFFFFVVMYAITLWHIFAIKFIPWSDADFIITNSRLFGFLPLPFLRSDKPLVTLSILPLWYIVSLVLTNTVSQAYFAHSLKAKRIAKAIVDQAVVDQKLRLFAENVHKRIHVEQKDQSWVTIKHDLPISSLWFRQKKIEISASAQLRIVEQREVAEWEFAYKCEFYRPNIFDLLSAGDWVENQEWIYFITYYGKLSPDENCTESGKVCKIGISKNVEEYRFKTYRTSNPDAKIELKILASEFSEDDAKALFAERKIDGEVYIWEGAVEKFVEQRRMQQHG